MSISLVGQRRGKRSIRWGRIFSRVPAVGCLSLILFLGGSVWLVTAIGAPRLEMWWAEHFFIVLLGFEALAFLLGLVVPVVLGLRRPLDRLPDLDVPADQAEGDGFAAWFHSWRYLFGALALFALVALVYAEENWRGRQLWELYKGQSAARGEPLEASAFIPPLVPDEENFAMTPFLASVLGLRPWTRPASSAGAPGPWSLTATYDAAAAALKKAKIVPSNSWVTAQTDLPAWQAAFLKGTNHTRPPASELVSTNLTLTQAAAGVLAALAECDPVLEELRAARRLPHSRFNLDYGNENPASILLPHLSALKNLCRILQLRASAELALGKTDAALDDLDLMFRLTDATREEPILISHLVRLAEWQLALQPLAEGLARHEWSEAQLRALEERLLRFDFCADIKRALQAERVLFGDGLIEIVRRSPDRYRTLMSYGGNSGSSSFDLPAALGAAAPNGWFYFEKLNYSRHFRDCVLPRIDVSGRCISPRVSRQADQGLDAIFKDPVPVLVFRHEVFSALLLPALGRAAEKTAFAQTSVDTAGLACALERYRLTHNEFPQSLDALVPGFIDRLPHDLINRQPLKYRRTGDGEYLLYSVGWNETDEGGCIGLSQSGDSVDRQKGDWVWRLPARR